MVIAGKVTLNFSEFVSGISEGEWMLLLVDGVVAVMNRVVRSVYLFRRGIEGWFNQPSEGIE